MENDVYPMIRDEFQNGSDEKKAFTSICQKRELEVPIDSTVEDWLKRLHDLDVSLEEEIRGPHHKLLCEIIGQYAKFKYAMLHLGDWKNGCDIVIQDRLIFSAENKFKAFTLVDSFSGELRTIQDPIDALNLSEMYYPPIIREGRILLSTLKDDIDHLLLVHVNFDQLKCSILDNVPLNFISQQIVTGSSDSSHFMLFDEDNAFYKGKVANDQIHFAAQKIEFGSRLAGCNLIGDQLFALRRAHGNRTHWHYTQYDLSSNSARKVNEWSLSEDLTTFLASRKFVWANNKMYAACRFYSNFSIVVFDSDLRTWSTTKFSGKGYVRALEIDEDNVLTVSVGEDGGTTKTVYRLPMQKPDKLCYLAWSTIRRGSLFFGSKIYEKFNLPYNSEFRSFFEYQ